MANAFPRHITNCYTNLVWECVRGHRWKALPSNVKGSSRKRGTWCLKCANLRRVFNSPGDIEKMRDLARARGGRCLSQEYVNSNTRLEWECEQGHRWRAVPRTVSAGSWCPICARNQRLTLEEFQTLARRRGGKCLSSEYKNKETKLRWRCSLGHDWFAKPGDVKKGSWCRKCAIERRRSRWKKPVTDSPLPVETITVLVSFLRFSKVFFPGSRERTVFSSPSSLEIKALTSARATPGSVNATGNSSSYRSIWCKDSKPDKRRMVSAWPVVCVCH